MAFGTEIGIDSIHLMTVQAEMINGKTIPAETELSLVRPNQAQLAAHYPDAAEVVRGTPLPGSDPMMKPEGLQAKLDDPDHLAFAMQLDQQRQVGVAGLYHFFGGTPERTNEPLLFAYILDRESRGKGLGVLALGLAMRVAFEREKKAVRLRTPYGTSGTVPVWAMASSLAMEKLGYKTRGGVAWTEYRRSNFLTRRLKGGDLGARIVNGVHTVTYTEEESP